MNYKLIYIIPLIAVLFACCKSYTPEDKEYIKKIEAERKEKDEWMKNDPSSPFNAKSKVHFEPLKYYDVDPAYRFKSKLNEYDKKDTVTIYGTKGEPRQAIRYGYVIWNKDNKAYKISVYRGTTRDGEIYYSIWFTDKTTGDETYGVGRYLDFEINPSKDFIYTIDFNDAYNPYCSYSPDYSCAIPTKEDHIDEAVKAGEKKFH